MHRQSVPHDQRKLEALHSEINDSLGTIKNAALSSLIQSIKVIKSIRVNEF